VPFFSGFCVAC